jgi:hypothetical protein
MVRPQRRNSGLGANAERPCAFAGRRSHNSFLLRFAESSNSGTLRGTGPSAAERMPEKSGPHKGRQAL